MATSCDFVTTEASTKSWFRSNHLIDKYLKITNLAKFRTENSKWSAKAKEDYGVEGRLFGERQMLDHIQAVPNKEMFKKIDNVKGIFYQEEEIPASIASPETIGKIKRLAEKMGINIQSIAEYAKQIGLDIRGVNAIADAMRKIIAVAEGKENVALTEELTHIATQMVEQSNPSIITEIISKIDRFKIYKTVLNQYRDNPAYQLPNGKPDIRKIKKEAADKLIAEVIIYQNEGDTEFPELMQEAERSTVRNWWNRILDWIRGTYRKANIDVFQEVARTIQSGNIPLVNVEGTFYQLSSSQESIQKRFEETDTVIEKHESKETTDPILMDTEEASSFYYNKVAQKKVKNRVTDRVKRWFKENLFGRTFDKEETELNELKRQFGVLGHQFIEHIHGRFFNKDGTRRTTAGEPLRSLSPRDQKVYDVLEDYFINLIAPFLEDGKNPLIFSERVVYDENRDEAGTLDLLIVEEDGTAHNLDWKFITYSAKSDDIQWYKKGAFNVQLGRYKEMLMDKYGIKKFGMSRAIPFMVTWGKENPKDMSSKWTITGISAGSVDPKNIEDLRLLPFSQETESTGYEQLDRIISELNTILKQIGEKVATTEEEKEFKAERMNALSRAIRILHTKNVLDPLIEVIDDASREGERIINEYNMIFKDKRADDPSLADDQISEFAAKLREYNAQAQSFADMPRLIGHFIYSDEIQNSDDYSDEDKTHRKKILDELTKQSNSILNSKDEIWEISKQFGNKFIGKRNFEMDILSPEAVVKGLGAMFNSVSEISMASLRVLYRIVTNSKNKASREALDDVKKLDDIRKRIVDKGGDVRELVKKIYQKDDENKFVNKLIRKYDPEFYKSVDENAVEGKRDKNWLNNNIDIAAYKKEADVEMQKRINRHIKRYDKDPELRDRLIEEEKRKWDISRNDFNGWNNYIMKRHPLPKWYSQEYKDIMSDSDLLDLYNFITEINDKAYDAGYLQNKTYSTFIPFVRKSMAESLAWDFGKSAIMNFGSALKIDQSSVGYGKINNLTQSTEYGVPKYYTYDFTQEEGMSDVSEDIFRNMILYIEHMNKYKYYIAVEEQLKLLKDIEQSKGHLLTTVTGDVVLKEGKPVQERGNIENTKIFDDFLRGVFYEQKYPLSDSDTPIGASTKEAIKKLISKATGKPYEPSEEESAISLVKSIDILNRWFQLKTLGLEFISGAVNAFGANMQLAAQSGNYFTVGEVGKNELKLIGNRFRNDDEREMFIQLIDTFMPLKDDPSYDILRKSGMTSLTRANFSDALMFFMRHPEQHIEKSIFLTLLQNTMIENGRMINIREYVKSKYKDRYSSPEKYAENKRQIEDEIETLQKQRSIDAIKKLENGKLVIPGLDLNNINEIQRLTSLTRMVSRKAVGALTDADYNRMSFSIWTKSVMIFKNWIPKLLKTRFSQFEKVSDDFSIRLDDDENTTGEKYDVGRVRLWSYVIFTSIRDLSTNILNIINVNDKGILMLDELYEKYSQEYQKRTGKPMTLSREEFNDLIITNLKNQMRELAMLFSLLGLSFAMGAMVPPDDASKAAKNSFRWTQRVVDRFVTELSFFYSPVEFGKLLSGNMFPAIGVFNDILKFVDHTTMEFTGMDISNPSLTFEEVQEKAQPIKYTMRLFPFTKSLVTYGALIDSDFAKEFDVTIQKESKMK